MEEANILPGIFYERKSSRINLSGLYTACLECMKPRFNLIMKLKRQEEFSEFGNILMKIKKVLLPKTPGKISVYSTQPSGWASFCLTAPVALVLWFKNGEKYKKEMWNTRSLRKGFGRSCRVLSLYTGQNLIM